MDSMGKTVPVDVPLKLRGMGEEQQQEEIQLELEGVEHMNLQAYRRPKKASKLSRKAKHQCEDCGKQVFSKASLRDHRERKHAEWKGLACSVCNKHFNLLNDLKQHARDHELEGRPFKCEPCNKVYQHQRSLRFHLTQFHSQVQVFHVCAICGRCFRSACDVKRHGETHLGPTERLKLHECKLCTKKYFYKSNLENHIRSHTGEKWFRCKFCSWSCRTRQGIMLHTKKIHTNPDADGVACTGCNVKLSPNHLKIHIKQKHCPDPETYICSFCQKSYSTARGLKYHEHRMHDDMDKRDSGFRCIFCKRSFSMLHDMEQHIVSHTKEKPHKCTTCNSEFGLRSNLLRHVRVTHGPRDQLFSCQFCAKSFPFKFYLKKHVSTVHEAAKLACSQCGLLYSGKFNLARHVRQKHPVSDLIRFYCLVCPKYFSRKYELRFHNIRVHIGLKFRCELCSFTTSYKNHLKSHIQREHVGRAGV